MTLKGMETLREAIRLQAADHSIRGDGSNRSGDFGKRAGDSRRMKQRRREEENDAEAKLNQQRPPLIGPGKNKNTQASGSLRTEDRRNERAGAAQANTAATAQAT
jgi:hypothetical protein